MLFEIMAAPVDVPSAPQPTFAGRIEGFLTSKYVGRVEGFLSSKSPFYAKKMEGRKEKVRKAEKAQQRAYFEHLRYLNEYQEAHKHIKVGNENRDKWIELNKQKQKSDSQFRRHTIIANSMIDTLPGISQPMQHRANQFKKNSDQIQTEMDKLSKHRHYDSKQADEHINAHLARQEAHDHIMAGHKNTIRKNSRPWPL